MQTPPVEHHLAGTAGEVGEGTAVFVSRIRQQFVQDGALGVLFRAPAVPPVDRGCDLVFRLITGVDGTMGRGPPGTDAEIQGLGVLHRRVGRVMHLHSEILRRRQNEQDENIH